MPVVDSGQGVLVVRTVGMAVALVSVVIEVVIWGTVLVQVDREVVEVVM